MKETKKKRRPLLTVLKVLASLVGAVILAFLLLIIFGKGNLSIEKSVDRTELFEADASGYPSLLHISGNEVYNESGEKVVLRGVMVPDPKKLRNSGRFNEEYFDKVFALGGNVVRIPVHPDYYTGDKDYMWRYLDPIVEWAGNNGHYVIIDWHCIGNPATGNGDNISSIKDDVAGESRKFWEQIAAHFKNVPNVIFEIYNEPTNIQAEKWGKTAADLVETIRMEDKDHLIIAGSPEYSRNLTWLKSFAPDDGNIAYSVHLFPSHANWRQILESNMSAYPLLVTEWGYSDDDVQLSQSYLFGSAESFGKPISDFMIEHEIGWVASWWDDSWEPVMISKETGKLTKWGEFLTGLLK